MDKIEELKKLKGLLDNGLVTQEEFDTLKDEILGITTLKQQEVEKKEVVESNEPKVEPKKDPVPKPENVSLERDKPDTSATQEKLDRPQKNSIDQVQKDESKDEKEIKPKCKKCNKEISKYIDESNKGICIGCKEKSVSIPKWTYLFLLFIIPLGWWLLKDDKKNETPSKIQVDAKSKAEQFFTINGNDIWVRSIAKTGEVVMKLNTDDTVMVLDSCCQESIKGNKSYWYKIDYNGKQGWFFGSQTKEYLLTSQKTNDPVNIPENSNFLNLKLLEVNCYEGNECRFEFIDSNSKKLIFNWFLEPTFADKNSYEDIFMKKHGTGYNGFSNYYGQIFTVYFSKNDKSPGTCRDDEEIGPYCTKIINMQLYLE